MSRATAQTLRREGKHDEARTLLVRLAAESPQDAQLQYETACVHDFLGLEALAVPYYLKALSGDLPADMRRGAYTGLGRTYRTLGAYEQAERTLRDGLAAFPAADEMTVFLAMVLHNRGQSKLALEELLRLLAGTSSSPGIKAYAAAIAFYAQDVDRVWPAGEG